VYEKPSLQRFGTFRDLTRWGFASASDGGSILGISSPGCETDTGQWGVYRIGCPTTPSTS
jgi:hypothetical protein